MGGRAQAGRREQALEQRQRELGGPGEGGDERRTGEHLHEVALAEAVHDVAAKAAPRDERRQRGGGNHLDSGGAHAGHHDGDRVRHLDRDEDPQVAHAQAAAGVDDLGVDVPHADVRVGDDGRDR